MGQFAGGNAALPTGTARLDPTMPPWSVDIIRGRRTEHLGIIEAPDQREAYRLAIEKFNVPIERQNRLFVGKLDDRTPKRPDVGRACRVNRAPLPARGA